jgi:CII-binding regulator of phage lambda lysogenization HflD
MFNSYQKETSSERILSQNALEKVKDAEEKYLDAITGLEDLAYYQLENTTEPLAQLYRNKLSLIDRQIQNCQEALETNPANSHIRRYLMAALQDKQKTLEDILEVSS